MPRLAEGFVNELKGRIDLYDVVSPYVQLKKSGSSWVGLSPFSQEKSPSFYVHPDKGFFKCFSSGEGGDAISFIQKIENLEFTEAIEFLAQRFSIPLQYSEETGSSAKPAVSRSLKSDLYELHKLVAEWFHQRLFDEDQEAQSTRKYWLEDRGFSLETAKEFLIGYAPVDRFALGKYLNTRNFSLPVLKKSGLFREGKGKELGPAVFTGRLMIPICDKIGRICAFTARKLEQTPEWGDRKSPKYVNSPETPIFEKGNLLFNLHLANKEISEESEFLLVEGQLDAIRCWDMGFRTVVAPQGTAFKDSQALLLYRSKPKGVVCLLDGDNAGQKAALSYVSIFLKSGLDARFAELPEGSDPDQILIEGGKSAMQRIIDQAKPMIEYVIRQKLPDLSTASPKQKETTCQWFFSSLAEIDSRIALEGYLEQLSRLLGVPIDALKSDFLKFRRNRTPAYRKNAPEKENQSDESDRLTIVEEDLLFLLLHDDRLASPLANTLDMSWVDTRPVSGRILAKILSETHAEGTHLTRAQIEDLLEDDEERRTYHRLAIQEMDQKETGLSLRLARQCVNVLFLRSLKQREDFVFSQLKGADNDSDTLKKLSQELRSIRKQRSQAPLLEFTN
ncbi:MAG: DNA primase [Opitutales bacterium]